MQEILSLLYPLSLTIMIEYIIIQLLLRDRYMLGYVLIVNICTNPAINIIARVLWQNTIMTDYAILTIISILEIVVFIVEGVLYKYMLKITWKKALIISFVANFIAYMASWLI